jgi:hypothetical protein
MKKYFGFACLGLLFLLLGTDKAVLQETSQKVPPVPEVVYAPVEQVNPQIQALTDQLKYYRTIGDTEKANEIWQKLTPFINYAPERGEKAESGTGMVIDSGEPNVRPTETWWPSTYWAILTFNNDKSSSMEVVSGHGTYNPNMYIAAEEWSGQTNPLNIMLKRSDNHGTTWPSTTAYQKEVTYSGYQLSIPKMKQILPDYLGIVFQRRYSATDYDIHWVKQKWDFSSSTYGLIDNALTYDSRPDIASDYEYWGSGAYIYVVYYEGNPPTALLLRSSYDGGATWTAAQTLATFTSSTASANPQCSIDYEYPNLYIAYTEKYYFLGWREHVAVIKSSNDGVTWSSPLGVTNLLSNAYYPSIAAKGNTVIVAYEYPYSSTDMDLYYSYSTDAGASFTGNNALATTTSNEFKPIVRSYAGVGTYLYCAWNQAPTYIELARTTSAAPTTWSLIGNVKQDTKNIAQDDIPGLVPKLTPTGSNLGVAVSWAAYYDSTYGYDVATNAYWQSCLPASFTNVSPANGATNVPVAATLDWNTSSQATSYDVYFGTSSSPPYAATTTSSYWAPPSMGYSTLYYWYVIAKNSCGTLTGSQWSFTTQPPVSNLPTVTTNAVTSITAVSAVSGGNVTSDGGASVTARGVCWSTFATPTTANPHTTNGTGTGTFTSNITGLYPNTHYYVRAYATNSAGTAYGNQQEFTTATWIQIPGNLSSLVAGDFNNNGIDDLAGLNASGAVYYSTNLSTWTAIPGAMTFSSLVVGDFNNDGKDDIAGLTTTGSIYMTTNLSTWTSIPGTMASLVVGDFDNNGYDDLAGVNASGAIYYTTNLTTWTSIPGTMAGLVAGDFNNDGIDDLAGLNASGWIYFTTNLSTWTRIPGTMAKLVAGDFNNDGYADLAGLNASGWIYYTTNRSTWTRILGTMAKLVVGDFNNNGYADLAGLNASGWIFFTTNVSTWTRIPGILNKLVAGDFNNDGKYDLAGLNAGGSIFYTLF